ncbi:MAG: DUF885 domain-containing protein [Xanthomonadales bacterium]|nr:DUF885 domain-containing protein [Xanthomonadales bacterium]MCB1594205.1 DUF885 domain-containing protein [Xanthomonadales bacterium]
MKTKTAFIAILIMMLNACQKNMKQENVDLSSFYSESTKALFSGRPSNSTQYGLSEEMSGGEYQNRLDDYSPAAEKKLRASLRAINQQLSAESYTDENKSVMQDIIRYFSGHEDFDIGYIDVWMGLSPFIVNQINGPLIDIPNIMVANHQVNNSKQVQDYLQRLDHFDIFVQQVLEKLEYDTDKNWIPPKAIVNKTISAMQSFIETDASNHPLVTSFAQKLQGVNDMNDDEKSQAIKKAEMLVAAKVYPAFKSVVTKLNDLKLMATEESGIWAQPNGGKYYLDAIKMLGDSDLTPQQIHDLGLSEVERITSEMDEILNVQGMTEGTVGERMMALLDDSRFIYEDSEAGRAELLNDLNKYIQEISAMMDEQFATRPKYDVEVRKFPKAREESAPGGQYTNPPLDGSQPGIYWINLRDIKANPRFEMKTLTYHEAIPGHHWQVALNLEQEDLPMLRRIAPYNAYVEGWALYSELVGKEMGLYKNDPFSDLGRLKAELFRAVRLVVDTGLHYKKWSREQAIKYMMEIGGVVESDAIAEVERYMVWPGQALGYKLGMIQIVKLRNDAMQKLGDKFDIKEFHDVVLLGGAVPMSVLESKIHKWVVSNM